MVHGIITALAFCMPAIGLKGDWEPALVKVTTQMVSVLDLGTQISSENVAASVF
jgi:hypothetical protein